VEVLINNYDQLTRLYDKNLKMQEIRPKLMKVNSRNPNPRNFVLATPDAQEA